MLEWADTVGNSYAQVCSQVWERFMEEGEAPFSHMLLKIQ
jgi:hypothetical protein